MGKSPGEKQELEDVSEVKFGKPAPASKLIRPTSHPTKDILKLPRGNLMHRNVARHLPRRRLQCAPPTTSTFTIASNQQHASTDQESPPPQDTTAWPANTKYTAQQTQQLLQTLDQKTLHETRSTLSTYLSALDAFKTALPSLIPAQNAQDRTYTCAEHRRAASVTANALGVLNKQAQHVRAHLGDLQTSEYERPGGAGGEEKEEGKKGELVTRGEKEARLRAMQREEEAELHRLRIDAMAHLRQVEELGGGKGRQGEGGGSAVVRKLEGKGERGEEKKGKTGREAPGKGKDEGGDGEGKSQGSGSSLADMQRNLSESLIRR